MENKELTVHNGNIVCVLQNNGLGEIIKPLSQEIHLFDSFIAGTTHLSDKSVLESVKIGDCLFLQRENSKFDSNAITVLNAEKKKLGYIPEKDNLIFARLMDAGKLLTAKVGKIAQKGTFTQIGIGIYLIDF